jgi:putative flippase GtrA
MNNKTETNLIDEFYRYLFVGGVAFAVDMGMLWVLAGGLGFHYLHASLWGFVAGTWVNYQLSVRWVFGYRAVQQAGMEFGLFLLVGVITLGFSLGLMALLVDGLALHYLMAKCVVTAFTLIANFAARRILLFTSWRRPMPVEVEE